MRNNYVLENIILTIYYITFIQNLWIISQGCLFLNVKAFLKLAYLRGRTDSKVIRMQGF